MTPHGVRPSTRPTENWQHRLLHRTPTGTEPEWLIQSAYRNTVENNMRRNRNKNKDPLRRKNNNEVLTVTFS
jgi:hypothetical protein